MVGQLQPLQNAVAIVNAAGFPTPYFIKWAQQRQEDISAGITEAQALALIEQFMTDHPLQAGSGITLTPSGDINDSPTIAADVQAILDQISTTRGSVLYRGVADWVALAPGTAGQFLQTSGAGADPVWASGGGGGSLTTIGAPVNLLNTLAAPSVNFYLGRFLVADVNFTISKIAFMMSAAVPTTRLQPFVYSSLTNSAAQTLLGSGPQVIGVANGYNEAPLTSPVAVTKGQPFWVGISVTTAALVNLWQGTGGLSGFAANGGSTVPAASAPSFTGVTTAGQVYGLWGVA